jgi:MFS family permease
VQNKANNIVTRTLNNTRDLYNEYPSQFWVLVMGTFIDRLGGALLFPFFTLYITRKFNVGMTQVGVIFSMFALSSVAGSMIGGALTDRLGRKGMLLFGLVASATSSIVMGLVGRIETFYAITIFVGLLANSGGPAQQAMVADLLPEEKRAQGFGILRVVVNLAVTIGPMIGGLLAAQSYLLLFISDAVASLITAGIVFKAIEESKPETVEGEAQQTMAQTFSGYWKVMQDAAFVWFLVASALMVIVYTQMNSTLAVYLRDYHRITEQGFGYILSLNAGMVVLFQFPITRWISKYRPLIVMTVGTLLYGLGFAMYGFVAPYFLFLVAMAIITIGEMFVSPVGQAIVSHLAPEDMRGRYMAVFGFSWVIPIAIGPFMAGLVIDNYDPNWVWYGAGIIALVAAAAYFLLDWRVSHATYATIEKRLDIIEALETGQISAEEAARKLETVQEGSWARLKAPTSPSDRRHVRIRISDLSTGRMKNDLRLPMGLVNTVLLQGGLLSSDLEGVDSERLEEMITRSSTQGERQVMDTEDDQRLEVSLD